MPISKLEKFIVSIMYYVISSHNCYSFGSTLPKPAANVILYSTALALSLLASITSDTYFRLTSGMFDVCKYFSVIQTNGSHFTG